MAHIFISLWALELQICKRIQSLSTGKVGTENSRNLDLNGWSRAVIIFQVAAWHCLSIDAILANNFLHWTSNMAGIILLYPFLLSLLQFTTLFWVWTNYHTGRYMKLTNNIKNISHCEQCLCFVCREKKSWRWSWSCLSWQSLLSFEEFVSQVFCNIYVFFPCLK